MNKLLLCAGLALAGLQGTSFAQSENEETTRNRFTMTERIFNGTESNVRVKEFIHLANGKMIIELASKDDHKYLADIITILRTFRKDMAFYADTLAAGTGSVRISYLPEEDHGYRKLRFRRYPADGDMFLSRTGEASRLKVEDDTIKLLLHATPATSTQSGPKYAASVTFCLNNYSDIDKIIADSATLQHVVDTLTGIAAHTRVSFYSVVYSINVPSGSRYPDIRYRKVNYLLEDNNLYKPGDMLVINGGLGVGLVKNTLAPMGDIGIEINRRWRGAPHPNMYNFIRVSATPYFFFAQDANNKTLVRDNWFANLEWGTENHAKKTRAGVGVSYLYALKGDYFEKETFKFYATIRIGRFTVNPEFICNNNFRQIYPAITLKLWNF